jgi:lysophospholipase L1-like esterase
LLPTLFDPELTKTYYLYITAITLFIKKYSPLERPVNSAYPYIQSATVLLLSLSLTSNVLSKTIPAGDERILTLGTKYVTRTENSLHIDRFRTDVLDMAPKDLGMNPKKARTTSGIVLAFQTDSPTISMTFQSLPGENRGSEFGIFENGKFIEEFKFSKAVTPMTFEIQSTSASSSLFEISLPSWSNVELLSVGIEDTAKLEPCPIPSKKTYVALGDSISHGVGQGSATHKTWPFLLSRKLDAELFNLSVGGGKVSIPTAEMLADWEKIDLITILIGYNDLHFDKKSPEEYGKKYNELLDTIRKNHPETPIFCITPLYTKKPVSEKTGHSIQQFRETLVELIGTRNADDTNIHLIRGEEITSEKSLRQDRPSDPVHLGIGGAAQLAEEMFGLISNKQ